MENMIIKHDASWITAQEPAWILEGACNNAKAQRWPISFPAIRKRSAITYNTSQGYSYMDLN